MKRSIIALSFAVLLLTMSGCHKDVHYGNVMFWFDQNQGTGTVSINGQHGTISGFVTGGVPACENSVSATFRLPEGSYSYSVTTTGGNGFSWNGTALVYADQCQLYQLQ